MKPENKKSGIYTTMVQPIAQEKIKMPTSDFNYIYESGHYVTTSNGRYPQVHKYNPVTGKDEYVCTLHALVKDGTANVRPVDGNWRNQTLSNLKAI